MRYVVAAKCYDVVVVVHCLISNCFVGEKFSKSMSIIVHSLMDIPWTWSSNITSSDLLGFGNLESVSDIITLGPGM